MKSRAITLGASVIALALAGATQAQAGVLGNGGPQVPDTGIAPKVEANVEVNAKAQVKAGPVAAPLKASVEAGVRGSERPRASVETTKRTSAGESRVVLDANGHGLTAYADQRRNGKTQLEAAGHVAPGRIESGAKRHARRARKAGVHGPVRTAKAKHDRVERSVRRASRHVAGAGLPPWTAGHDRGPTPLQAIGRQVENSIGPIHAGWLLVLAVTGCLALPGLMRRLHKAG